MIFDWYKEGESTIRVIAINDKQIMSLETWVVYNEIDFENEVEEILIENVFDI